MAHAEVELRTVTLLERCVLCQYVSKHRRRDGEFAIAKLAHAQIQMGGREPFVLRMLLQKLCPAHDRLSEQFLLLKRDGDAVLANRRRFFRRDFLRECRPGRAEHRQQQSTESRNADQLSCASASDCFPDMNV